jgi:hypothetical protein
MNDAVEFYVFCLANDLILGKKTESPDSGFVWISSHPLGEYC